MIMDIIMMNVFIVAAGAGGDDRWLMKTIMRNGAVFPVCCGGREGTWGAVFAAIRAALRQCRVKEKI